MAVNKNKVKGMGSAWSNAVDDAGSDFGETVPVDPGNYIMQLVGCDVVELDSGDKIVLKYCVLNDDEFGGCICSDWLSLEEERLVWIVRLLKRLGIDISEIEEPETAGDIADIFQDLIDDYKCAKVRIVEKDGYKNFKKVEGIDDNEELDLVDPAEALKSNSSSGNDDDEDEDEEEYEEYEFEKGDEVLAKGKLGTITAVDEENETAKVKLEGKKRASTFSFDDLEWPEEDEDEDEEEADEEEAEEPTQESEFSEGARVKVDFGDDEPEWYEGVITSVSADSDEVEVTFDDGDIEDVATEDIVLVADDSDDDEAEEDEEETFEVGDQVEHDGKECEIKSIKGSTATLKIPGKKKPVKVKLADLVYAT